MTQPRTGKWLVIQAGPPLVQVERAILPDGSIAWNTHYDDYVTGESGESGGRIIIGCVSQRAAMSLARALADAAWLSIEAVALEVESARLRVYTHTGSGLQPIADGWDSGSAKENEDVRLAAGLGRKTGSGSQETTIAARVETEEEAGRGDRRRVR